MAMGDMNMSRIDIQELGAFATAPATTYERPETDLSWELIWIAEGNSRLVSAESSHLLPPHSVVLAPPSTPLVFEWDLGRVTRGGYVVFSAEPGAGVNWPLLRLLAPDDVVLALLRHLIWLDATRNTELGEQAQAGLAYALHAYESGASGTSYLGDRNLPEPIERSMELVRKRWSSGIPLRTPPLEELAAAAAVTREHLCRVYVKELGYGPIAALRLLRLRYAASLLTRTNLTVGQVAHEAGFETQFHFSRTFKHTFGMPPTGFRQASSPPATLPDAVRRLGLYL